MATELRDERVDAALQVLYGRAAAAGFTPRPVAGISIGGCCSAFGTERRGAFRRTAHAHTSVRDERHDWICVNAKHTRELVGPKGSPMVLLIHEYAHVITHQGHTERWAKACAALGAPNEAERVRRIRARK